jgi:ribosomal protein S8E
MSIGFTCSMRSPTGQHLQHQRPRRSFALGEEQLERELDRIAEQLTSDPTGVEKRELRAEARIVRDELLKRFPAHSKR